MWCPISHPFSREGCCRSITEAGLLALSAGPRSQLRDSAGLDVHSTLLGALQVPPVFPHCRRASGPGATSVLHGIRLSA